MSLSASILANEIQTAMGFSSISSQLLGFCQALVSEIQTNAKISNSLVTGDCPHSGGSLSNGTSVNGIISSLSGSRLASTIQSDIGFPLVTSNLLNLSNAIVNHIMGLGKVNFSSGNITGTCTNSAGSPGVLTLGSGFSGIITSLNGITLANDIHSAEGFPGSVSTQLIQFSIAIVNHIMSDGVGSYQSGTVTGICPAGGGPLISGSASKGKIN
jgi:hypothetical protein